jgi:hypothetical protein
MQYMGEENRAGTARLEWGSYSYTTIPPAPKSQISLDTPSQFCDTPRPISLSRHYWSQVDEVAR